MTCSRILKGHSATIDVDSTVGSGTTFIIYLPIEEASAESIPA